MSISLEKSPFKNSVPCRLASESLVKIWCSDKFCRYELCPGESCECYKDIKEGFVDESSEYEETEVVDLAVYQHFKGKQYRVLCVAEHSETGEKLVIYKALYSPYKVYARPLKMFTEQIEDVNYKYRGPRFRKVL